METNGGLANEAVEGQTPVCRQNQPNSSEDLTYSIKVIRHAGPQQAISTALVPARIGIHAPLLAGNWPPAAPGPPIKQWSSSFLLLFARSDNTGHQPPQAIASASPAHLTSSCASHPLLLPHCARHRLGQRAAGPLNVLHLVLVQRVRKPSRRFIPLARL